MGRSRKHRQRFACGHRGFGQWCHCCATNDSRRVRAIASTHGSVCPFPAIRSRQSDASHSPKRRVQAVTWDKQAWNQSFATDAIDLRRLPRAIVLKARGILAALAQGTGYWQLKGKRLRGDRTLVRIPVSYRYRLLCRMEGDRLMPLKVLSHEDYNPLVRQMNRV
jgi:hypothetical protein